MTLPPNPSKQPAPSGLAAGLLASLLLLGLSCAHTDSHFSYSSIQKLEKGQTSADVRVLVGTPDTVQKGINGKTLEVYTTSPRVKDEEENSRVLEAQALYVLYDASGGLERFVHYTNQITGRPGTKYRAGTFVSDAELERIVKDATTVDELIEYFGPPTERGLTVFGDNFPSWEYFEGRGSFRKGRRLNVVVDSNSVVTAFSTRDISPDKDR